MSGADSQAEKFVISRRNLLLSTAAVMAAAACSGGSRSTAALGLRYGEAGAFSTFNPWAQTLNQLSTANQMFSRLVTKNMDGTPVADAAESWQLAPDGLSISIKLRPGVKWHDGKPLDAADVVAMYGYLTDPALESDAGVQKIKELFAPVTGVTATDPTTVAMTFSSPVPYALDLLNYFYLVRLDDPADSTFVKHFPTGTGPYRMTGFTQGQNAMFEAFPDYFDPALPKVDKFRFDIFAEGSNLVSSLRSGQIDGALVSNYAQVDSLKGAPDYYIEQVRLGVWLLMVNASKPPFDNLAVRQALSWSMNRVEFAKVGNFGLEDPVTSPFYTAAATGFVPELVGAQAFDLARAKSLLEGAGVAGLTITFPFPSSYPNFGTYGQIWQSDLAKIGVTLKIEPVSQGRWGDLGSGKDPSVDVVPWQVGRCLQDGAVFFAANSGYRGADQRFGYQNPQLEQLVAAGQTETDPAKRTQIYRQLNELVVNECTNISFATYSETFTWSRKVTGPGYDLAGNLRVAGVEIAT